MFLLNTEPYTSKEIFRYRNNVHYIRIDSILEFTEYISDSNLTYLILYQSISAFKIQVNII